MNHLSILHIKDIHPLIDESANAFLPSKQNPETTSHDLFNEMQHDPKFKILGYVIDGSPVSYIVLLSYKDETATLAIGPMYVAQDFQGKGYGKKQIENLIQYAKSHDFTSIFTKTWAGNAGSRKIFEGLGFTVEKVKENDRVDGDSTISYRLNL